MEDVGIIIEKLVPDVELCKMMLERIADFDIAKVKEIEIKIKGRIYRNVFNFYIPK